MNKFLSRVIALVFGVALSLGIGVPLIENVAKTPEIKAYADVEYITVIDKLYVFDKPYDGPVDTTNYNLKNTGLSHTNIYSVYNDTYDSSGANYGFIELRYSPYYRFSFNTYNNFFSSPSLTYGLGPYNGDVCFNVFFSNYSSGTGQRYKNSGYSYLSNSFLWFKGPVEIPVPVYQYITKTASDPVASPLLIDGNFVSIPLELVPSSYNVIWYVNGESSTNTTLSVSMADSVYCYVVDLSNAAVQKFELMQGTLSAPVLSYDNGVITWEEVPHAKDYRVYNLSKETIATETMLNRYEVPEEFYGDIFAVKCMENGDFEESDWSDPITATAPAPDLPPAVQLAIPTLSLTSNVLSWSPVQYADYYGIYKGDVLIDTTTALFYSVYASGNYSVRAFSNLSSFSPSYKSNIESYTSIDFSVFAPIVTVDWDGYLRWNTEPTVNYYEVYKDGTMIQKINTNSYLPSVAGNYSVVAYVDSETYSAFSNVVAYKMGMNPIYQQGFEAGKIVGFQEGQEADDIIISFFKGVIDVPIKALQGLLDFEFLGFNLFSFFQGLITLAVVVAVVKIVFFFL